MAVCRKMRVLYSTMRGRKFRVKKLALIAGKSRSQVLKTAASVVRVERRTCSDAVEAIRKEIDRNQAALEFLAKV
jgi:hypothetical protein